MVALAMRSSWEEGSGEIGVAFILRARCLGGLIRRPATSSPARQGVKNRPCLRSAILLKTTTSCVRRMEQEVGVLVRNVSRERGSRAAASKLPGGVGKRGEIERA